MALLRIQQTYNHVTYREILVDFNLAIIARTAKPPNLSHRQIFRLYGKLNITGWYGKLCQRWTWCQVIQVSGIHVKCIHMSARPSYLHSRCLQRGPCPLQESQPSQLSSHWKPGSQHFQLIVYTSAVYLSGGIYSWWDQYKQWMQKGCQY